MQRVTLVLSLVVLMTYAIVAQKAQSNGAGKEEFTAVALSAGGVRSAPVATPVEITIERSSTGSERQRFLSALATGQNAALEVLQDLPRVGDIRTPGSLSWDLHYADQVAGEDGGRRIFLATDRPISAWEAVNQPRTIDYPFTFIELRLNGHGEGEGKLSRASRVISSRDGRFVHLENWDTEPVALTQVKLKMPAGTR